MVAGQSIRSRVGASSAGESHHPFETNLRPGAMLPDAFLVGTDGDTTTSVELVAGRGAIILFLDPECAPCLTRALHWQRVIDDGVVDNTHIVGVGNVPPDLLRAYREEHGFTFPIWSDVHATFRDGYGVTFFPYEVLVDAGGVMQAAQSQPLTDREISNARM